MPIYLQILPESLPISIESIGNHWQQSSLERKVGYPYYHWLQTEAGLGVVEIAEQQILLKVGEGILIPPFVPHRYFPKGDWLTQFVTFNGGIEAEFTSILGTSQFILSKDDEVFSFSKWITNVMDQVTNQELNFTDCSIGCYSFLLHLSKNYQQQRQQQDSLYLQYVDPVIHKIETDFSQELKVKELAQDCFISPQYLTRLFHRFTGKSTQEYLLDFRLLKAKELLINYPQQSIQQVAEAVGFSSSSRFSELFKERTKMTPREFRKQLF